MTVTSVPLLDLSAQFETIREEVTEAINEVVASHRYINGPAVGQLERAVAEYSDCAAGVGVSSGTDALLCSLMALDIGPGDEVITTPYTFFATAGSVWRTGARPVFVDIEADTYNLDPAAVEAAVTERTKAVLPVHLFGQVADMDPIMELAGRHDLAVVEDAAQSIGATYKGRRAGSIGTCGCFSFFPSKNLGGMGDGGMVVTRDEELGGRLGVVRAHGSKPKYFHKLVGGNFRLDTIQAAVVLVKLRRLEGWSEGRRKNAARYDELLAGLEPVQTPVIREDNTSIYNQYVIRAEDRDGLMAHLQQRKIGCVVYYPKCLHLQECFATLEHGEGDFPVSELASRQTLALPIYPELSDAQLKYVANSVREFYGG